MRFVNTIVLFFLVLVFIGCSGGGNPLIPSNPDSTEFVSVAAPDSLAYPRYVTESGAGAGVFGMFNLRIDPSNLKAEIVPIRNANLGAVYEADITTFLGSLCADCLRVVGVSLTEDGFLEVVFRMHHPIRIPEDPYNPKISDRLDLHLFDVRGIIITEGTRTFTNLKADVNGDGNVSEVLKCNPSLLNNADGYTTFFDTYMDSHGVNTQANLHPYKLFFKDPKQGNYNPAVNSVNGWITLAYPQGQNVFPQGDLGYNASYIFDIPDGSSINIVMLLDACYGHSAQFSIPYPEVGSRMNPRYFLPEFHRKEAWYAFVNITNNTLAYGDTYTSATVTVTAYDWQAGLTGAGALDYFTSPLTHLTNTSDVKEVLIYVPELVTNPINTYLNKSGAGTWQSPYVYTFSIRNEKNAMGGTYYGIAAIKDDLANTTMGPSGVGRDLSTITITDFINYQVFPIEVASTAPNQPPLAFFETDPDILEINSGDWVTFDGSLSYDPDGEIVLYEWDFEFEGLEFIPDETGATPPPHQYNNPDPSMPMIYFALMRVVDNGDPPLENMYGVEVIVLPNAPPVPIIDVIPGTIFIECESVILDASASYDNSAIVTYEWDFDYDPDIPEFNIDATGPVVERRFPPGGHNILLRVWDDSSIDAITRVRLVSEPLDGPPGEVMFCFNYLLNTQDDVNSNTFAGGGQHNIVLLPGWQVAALWVDESDVAGGPAIKFSMSTNGGRSFDPEIIANTNQITGGLQDLKPCLSGDQMGNLHLGYSDGDGTCYYQQKPFGMVDFLERIQVGTGSRTFGGPSITADSAGNIYYFYTGNESGGNVPLKLAQSQDLGNSFNSPITLFADGRFPSSASLVTGSCVVSFEGKNVPLVDNSDIFVSYQRSGTLFYPPIRVVDSDPGRGRSTNPSIAISPSGGIYIAWQDSRFGDSETDYDIFYSYSLTGLSYSQNYIVNNTNETPGNQIVQDCPSIGVDQFGAVFFAWRDYRDGTGGDIYFAFTLFPDDPIINNLRLNDDMHGSQIPCQGPPSMLVSPNSGILIIWGDERDTSVDLGTPLSGPADIYFTFGKLF